MSTQILGSCNPELSNCERIAHRSTNSGEYQLTQTHILQNVIVENQTENSDIQITLPEPENNIQNSSKETMRTSLPKIKYNFRHHNNTNYDSKYVGHIDGTNNTNKKNSSQRIIEEERKCTDQEKCSQFIVPPPYVPVQKSKFFKTSKQSPASTVPIPYLQENEKTISAPKITLKYRNPTYAQLTATKALYLYPTMIPPSTKQLFQSRLKILHLNKNMFRGWWYHCRV